MGRYKAREIAHFGVDYVKALIYVDEEKQKNHMLWKLSKNSNFIIIPYDGVELYCELLPIASEKYQKFYSIRYKNVSIAFIGLNGKSMGNITPKDMIEITGQGLNIFNLDVFYFLMDYFQFEFIRYKRIDFAMDLFLHVDYFFKNVLMDKFKKEKTYTPIIKKGECETIYFGEKDNKKNTYQLVRIYNKIIDSVKKEKLFLYNDRKDEKGGYRDVTRFEVEIREDLAKHYKYGDIDNINIVFAKMVKTFWQYNKQFFKFIDFEDFHHYEEQVKKEKKEKAENMAKIKAGDTSILPMSKHQEKILKKMKEQENNARYGRYFLNDEEEQRTIKMLVSMAKKLYKNGYTRIEMMKIISTHINEDSKK